MPAGERPPRGPWVLVAAAVAWNLLNLRAETLGVSYLDDSSVHEQMVRFAALQFRSGHLPLTSWFPYLGLGSPQFLHYQSLPAMLTGLMGLAVGPDGAYRWTLYILLSVWPVSIYISARLFGADRWAAGAAAAMSPFLVSVIGIGYEQKAYVWVGYGVWTQLWASVTLPLAWGFSWRAIREGRGYFAAVALVSLTVVLHFETGYLAILPLLLWPFVSGAPIVERLRRAGVLLSGSLLVSAWGIVPLIEQRTWAATNQILHDTPLVNGYGAGRVLGWLVGGRLLDSGRIPVVTLFAALGVLLACIRWRRDDAGRGLVVVLVGCVLLSFGRTTFGPLVDVIPGGSDLFFRRFMMGIQLAAVLLAGIGAAWCVRAISTALERWSAARGLAWPRAMSRNGLARNGIICAAAVLVLAPAWIQLDAYDAHNSTHIASQRQAEASEAPQLDRLIAAVKRGGGGRVYAGMPGNWGADFTVGAVPVFKYLESRDVDEVGYTLRTASLMTDPEYHFDESDLGDYSLFGIHYLILPSGQPPPIPAREVMRAGMYSLWTIGTVGYVHVGRIVGVLAANRTNVGELSIPILRSRLAQEGAYLRVAFGHTGAALQPLPPVSREVPTGSVRAERDDLDQGEVAVTVVMRRPGVVVLSSSFDPGWTATVNGRADPTEMVAPALVGARVPAGTSRIVFRYRGYADYPPLFALSGLVLAALLGAEVIRRRRRRGSAPERATTPC